MCLHRVPSERTCFVEESSPTFSAFFGFIRRAKKTESRSTRVQNWRDEGLKGAAFPRHCVSNCKSLMTALLSTIRSPGPAELTSANDPFFCALHTPLIPALALALAPQHAPALTLHRLGTSLSPVCCRSLDRPQWIRHCPCCRICLPAASPVPVTCEEASTRVAPPALNASHSTLHSPPNSKWRHHQRFRPLSRYLSPVTHARLFHPDSVALFASRGFLSVRVLCFCLSLVETCNPVFVQSLCLAPCGAPRRGQFCA